MYELWDVESGNRVGAYRTAWAALRDVTETVRRYGSDSAEARTLGLCGPHGPIAQGGALVQRSLAHAA